MKILFVCTGNICRSPTAEAIARQALARAGLADRVTVDSCGLEAWHVGNPPDPRSQDHAARRGHDLSELRGRQLSDADFEVFDRLLAMDRGHLRGLEARCPPEHRHKLALVMGWAPDLGTPEVADPYYDGPAAFERTLDLIEAAVAGLVRDLARGR